MTFSSGSSPLTPDPSPPEYRGRGGIVRPFRIAIFVSLALASTIDAHPVPRENHDRTVRVRLVPTDKSGEAIVRVDYRLEVDELTVVLDDMRPYHAQVDYAAFKGQPLGYYAEYAKIYAPILASKLRGTLDGRPLEFKAVRWTPTLRDDDGKDLGHLRCDFVFEAPATYPLKGPFAFEFREGAYLLEKGDVKLSLDESGPWFFDAFVTPSEELWKLEPTERPLDFDSKVREIKAKVHYFPKRDQVQPPPAVVAPPPTVAPLDDDHSLLRLFQSDRAFWLAVLLSAWFGGVHALTPGHGKTLVAAYLVGQRGTVVHAVALGVICTLTHTWSVIALAGVVHWFGLSSAAWIQSGLPLILGLMIACFGFYLLYQRLAGRADHVHVGGGHHHHHDVPTETDVTWKGLFLLGFTGSIIPCWEAIAMFASAVAAGQVTWALPMLLAFSAGLAAVLVTVGIFVVKVRGFAEGRFGDSRWIRWLPIVSAVAIIVLGFWLCRQAVAPVGQAF